MLRLTLVLALALAAVASPPTYRAHQQPTHHVRKVKAAYQDRVEPVISQEFVEAHQAFTLDLIKSQVYSETVEKFGAVSVSPLTFGHFLALVNEKTFAVPTVSIPKVLHLGQNKVAEAYSVLVDAHEDDHKAHFTSQVYSANENLVLTPGQTQLGLHRQTVHFDTTTPSLINSHVRVATKEKIVDALVPNVPAFDKDVTKGVFVNTYQYNNYFENELLNIGKKPFQAPGKTVEVDTLEVIGTFPVFETSSFQAVALPLDADGEDKHIVFVLPKTTLKQYLSSEAVDYVLKTDPTNWITKTIRVQVPKINITLAHNVEQYIVSENVVCTKDQAEQLNPIVQVTNLLVNHEEISYAVTTGAQVTSVKAARQNNVPKTQRERPLTSQYRLEPVVQQKENYLTVQDLVFNKPFFTYFYETTYGPFGYTAISHVFTPQVQGPTARHHDNPFDFSEATKTSRFTCEGLHQH